jgi:hypothetical protein
MVDRDRSYPCIASAITTWRRKHSGQGKPMQRWINLDHALASGNTRATLKAVAVCAILGFKPGNVVKIISPTDARSARVARPMIHSVLAPMPAVAAMDVGRRDSRGAPRERAPVGAARVLQAPRASES